MTKEAFRGFELVTSLIRTLRRVRFWLLLKVDNDRSSLLRPGFDKGRLRPALMRIRRSSQRP
jgi:hypothetical protein